MSPQHALATCNRCKLTQHDTYVRTRTVQQLESTIVRSVMKVLNSSKALGLIKDHEFVRHSILFKSSTQMQVHRVGTRVPPAVS